MTIKDALNKAVSVLKRVTESYYLESLLLVSYTLNIKKKKSI